MSITSLLEHVAEDLISCRLQESEILVAKPKFDVNGADLLGFVSIDDGAKFCRIQCKGRSVVRSPTNIKIPSKYVTAGFAVVLYLELSEGENLLCCFFEKDIKKWKQTPKKEYQLSLSKKHSSTRLHDFKWSQAKADGIKKIIRQSNVKVEIGYLQGSVKVNIKASGTVTNANSK